MDLSIRGRSWTQSPTDTQGRLYHQNPSQMMDAQSEEGEGRTPERHIVAVMGIPLRGSDLQDGRIKHESVKNSKGMFELNPYEILN